MRALIVPSPYILLLAASSVSLTHADDGLRPTVQIEHTKPVACSRPSRSGDRISVHYRGRLQSTNVEFDQSYKRGSPFTFTLGAGQVIAGWDQGLLDMCPGEGRTLIIPPELGYGDINMGAIPPHSTLVFETELVDIVGVKQETLYAAPTSSLSSTTEHGGSFSIATAPPTPPHGDKAESEHDVVLPDPEPDHGPPPKPGHGPPPDMDDPEQAECHLLGPFALLVQGALGAVAVLSLVFKRYRETPKRPWKIFFFDVSKQVFGSMLTHVLNLAMSMMGSVAIVNAAKVAADGHAANDIAQGGDGRKPNPCSYYLLNLGIDTTLGIPVLYILLKVLHSLFLRTPLARPVESIKSGNYGQPPKAFWWAKQLLIYFLGLVGMKLFVFFLFSALPWLPWIGDWALRWTKGNEALEITFAMFIFPLAMNALQYWIIDSFIMDKKRGEKDAGYQQVDGEDDDHDEAHERSGLDGSADDDEDTMVGEQHQVTKSQAHAKESALEEVNPTPIPIRDNESQNGSGSASGKSSPSKSSNTSKRK